MDVISAIGALRICDGTQTFRRFSYSKRLLCYSAGLMKTETLNRAAAELGRRGGRAGMGKAKRRSKVFYRRLSELGVKARKAKAKPRR